MTAAGTILIAKETHALVCDEFVCEEKDPIDAKGFDSPIATYQVIGPGESFEQGRIYKKEKKGFSLSLDLDAIDESERQEIIEYLRIAGSSLK